ncbi:unnamed protein product [Parajaminaea phylloscopi]
MSSSAMLRILFQPAVLVTAFALVLVAFMCPDPLSSSGVSLMVISPVNQTYGNASSSPAAASTVTFGLPSVANNASSVATSTTTTPYATTSTAGPSQPLAPQTLHSAIPAAQNVVLPPSPGNQPLDGSAATQVAPVGVTGGYPIVPSYPVPTSPTVPPVVASQQPVVPPVAPSPYVAGPQAPPSAPASPPANRRDGPVWSTLEGERLGTLVNTDPRLQSISPSTGPASTPPQDSIVITQNERISNQTTAAQAGSGANGPASGTTSSANNSSSPAGTSPFAAPDVLRGQQLSLVEVKFGPLGSCYRGPNGDRTCTPASIQAQFATQRLASDGLAFDVSGLPAGLRTSPILLLSCVVTLIVILLLVIPSTLARIKPQLLGDILQSGQWQRYYDKAQHIALWVRLAVALLLLGTGISMRIIVSKAVYAFNANNASRTLPVAFFRPDLRTSAPKGSVGLQAYVGHAFTLLWVSVILLLVECWLERARLKREEAVRIARGDLEAKWGRDALDYAMNSVMASARSKRSGQGSTADKVDNGGAAKEWKLEEGYLKRSSSLSEPHTIARKPVPRYKGSLDPVLRRAESTRSNVKAATQGWAAAPVIYADVKHNFYSQQHDRKDSQVNITDRHNGDCPPYHSESRAPSRATSRAPSRNQHTRTPSTYSLPYEERSGTFFSGRQDGDYRRPFEHYGSPAHYDDDDDDVDARCDGQGRWAAASMTPRPAYVEDEADIEERILTARYDRGFPVDQSRSEGGHGRLYEDSIGVQRKGEYPQRSRSLSLGTQDRPSRQDTSTPMPLYATRVPSRQGSRDQYPSENPHMDLQRQRSTRSLAEQAREPLASGAGLLRRALSSRAQAPRFVARIDPRAPVGQQRQRHDDDLDDGRGYENGLHAYRYGGQDPHPQARLVGRDWEQEHRSASRCAGNLQYDTDGPYYATAALSRHDNERSTSPSASSEPTTHAQHPQKMGLRGLRYIKS